MNVGFLAQLMVMEMVKPSAMQEHLSLVVFGRDYLRVLWKPIKTVITSLRVMRVLGSVAPATSGSRRLDI
jgi:hypothetical protein